MISTVAVVILLVAINFFFSQMQRSLAAANLERLRAAFQDDQVGSNPYLVMKDINEMSSLNLVGCVSLRQVSPTNRVFAVSDPADCNSDLIDLKSVYRESIITAANGSQWKVGFASLNSPEFVQMLWWSRLTAIVTCFAIVIALLERDKRIRLTEQSKFAQREALAKLAEGLAHDIRSPLSALQLILKSSTTPDEERKALADRALGRINEIAENLLETSRKSKELQLSQVEQMLKDLRQEVRTRFSKSRISLSIVVKNCDLDRTVNLRKASFDRILSNLIDNSIEASPEFANISVLALADANSLNVSVEDRGQGLPPDFNIEDGQSSKSRGNGIGLSQAIELVRQARGTLAAERLPLGTKISIKLPFS